MLCGTWHFDALPVKQAMQLYNLFCRTVRPTASDVTLQVTGVMERSHEFEFEYEELRQVARRFLRGRHNRLSIQPTQLLHEAYLRLHQYLPICGREGNRLVAVVVRAMRAVVVDEIRRRISLKRFPPVRGASARADFQTEESALLNALGFQKSLELLRRTDERKAAVVELHLFGGLTFEEIAEDLGVATITVKRDWQFGKAWLARDLRGSAAYERRAG